MAKILIGTAGWSYKDWDGIVYPKNLKKTQHPVEYLAQYFDTIEINTSFYGHIRPEWGKSWCEKARGVNPDFEFTAKLNKAFTHAPGAAVRSTSAAVLEPTTEDERLAKAGLDSLASRDMLGALLAQFPISFKNTAENRAYLEKLLARFREYPLVLEVRHDSWNDPTVLGELAERGVAFCNIDQPRLGRSLRPTRHATSTVGYIRLHGRNYKEWFDSDNRDDRYNYLYKPKELEGWVEMTKDIAAKTEKTFVVTNNHFKGQAAVNALELKSLLKGKPVKAPPSLVQAYPAQLEPIAEPTGKETDTGPTSLLR